METEMFQSRVRGRRVVIREGAPVWKQKCSSLVSAARRVCGQGSLDRRRLWSLGALREAGSELGFFEVGVSGMCAPNWTVMDQCQKLAHRKVP